MKSKICIRCKKKKSFDDFYKQSLTPRNKCKKCMREITNNRNKEKNKRKDSTLYDVKEHASYYRF